MKRLLLLLVLIIAGCGGIHANDPQLAQLSTLVAAVEDTPTIAEHLELLEFIDTISMNPDWQNTLNLALADVRSHSKKWDRYDDDRKNRLLDLFVIEAQYWNNAARNLPKDAQ